MKIRLSFYAVIAALLLFAQQSALLHSFAHVSSSMHSPERQLPHSKVCDKCLAYAGISGAVQSDYPVILLKFVNTEVIASVAQLFASLSFFAFSSRAPPVFL